MPFDPLNLHITQDKKFMMSIHKKELDRKEVYAVSRARDALRVLLKFGFNALAPTGFRAIGKIRKRKCPRCPIDPKGRRNKIGGTAHPSTLVILTIFHA